MHNINFGVMLQGPGVNMNAWRHESVPTDASTNFDFYIDRARVAEAAGIDFVFIADGLYVHEKSFPHFLNRFEPVVLLSALAASTSTIGLVGSVSTTYSDPFTVARQIGSIDAISGGRAGWNAVTSPLEGSGLNYGREHPNHQLRYQIADEHLDVVTSLWDSWDDDAFLRDRQTGTYVDTSKMRPTNHHGEHFQVAGPLNLGRSAQGQPLIFQAGASDDGIEMAGKWADAVFTNGGTFEDAQVFYRRVKQSAQRHGRDPREVRVFPGIGPIVGVTEREAIAKLSQIGSLLTIDDALGYLSHFFERHDFGQYDLDAPFPDLGELGKNGFRSTSAEITRLAREQKKTLREVARETATLRVHIGTSESLIGTPAMIAEELIRWKEGDAADGFMLGFHVLGEGLDDFAQLVLPELVARGYHQGGQAGSTLRDHLGLPYRASSHGEAAADTDHGVGATFPTAEMAGLS